MNDYELLIEGALSNTVILSPHSYAWFGEPSDDLPEEIAMRMSSSSLRDYLIYSLQLQLYRSFYCLGAPAPSAPKANLSTASFTPFIHALSAANRGQGCQDPGWRLCGHDADGLIAERDGLMVWLTPQDIYSSNDSPLDSTDTITVLLPKELFNISPGFYVALGDRGFHPTGIGQTLLRFYWNLPSESASEMVGVTTAQLNKVGVAFSLKVLNAVEHYDRCDGGVLYVHQWDYRLAVPIVRNIYSKLMTSIRLVTPVFTKQLAPGLGLAENPQSGESFGMHRCGLLADGIVRGHELGLKSINDRVEGVRAVFAEAGISLATPFLNPASTDNYEFEAAPT